MGEAGPSGEPGIPVRIPIIDAYRELRWVGFKPSWENWSSHAASLPQIKLSVTRWVPCCLRRAPARGDERSRAAPRQRGATRPGGQQRGQPTRAGGVTTRMGQRGREFGVEVAWDAGITFLALRWVREGGLAAPKWHG